MNLLNKLLDNIFEGKDLSLLELDLYNLQKEIKEESNKEKQDILWERFKKHYILYINIKDKEGMK